MGLLVKLHGICQQSLCGCDYYNSKCYAGAIYMLNSGELKARVTNPLQGIDVKNTRNVGGIVYKTRWPCSCCSRGLRQGWARNLLWMMSARARRYRRATTSKSLWIYRTIRPNGASKDTRVLSINIWLRKKLTGVKVTRFLADAFVSEAPYRWIPLITLLAIFQL